MFNKKLGCFGFTASNQERQFPPKLRATMVWNRIRLSNIKTCSDIKDTLFFFQKNLKKMRADTPAQQFGYKAKWTILTSAPAAGLVWSLHIPRVSDLSCVLSEQLLVESKSHNNQHFTWPKYKYAIYLLANPWQQQQKKKSHMLSAEGKTSERHLIQTEIESGVVEAAENESLIVSHQREKRLL